MSSDATQSPLARAYDLVEAGRYDEARALLEPILADDRENPDAWWIYAHAVTDADSGRIALENVLRIDPNYPGAADLLRQAEAIASPKPRVSPVASATMPEAPSTMPDDFGDADDEPPAFTARKPSVSPQPQRRSAFPLIAVIGVIVIALVLIYLLLQTGGTTPAATPTAVSSLATATDASAAVATDEVTTEAMPTEAPTSGSEQATGEAGGIDYAALETAMAEFPIAESGIGVVDTSLGSTLMVSACTEAGRAMRTLLPQVMNTLARQSPSLGSDIQAVGARMLDCTTNTPFVTVATELATAQSYAQGSLSDSDFAATWRPQ